MNITEMMQKVKHDFTDIHPYIFESNNLPPKELEETDDIIAAPFRKFSIETDGGYITYDKENNILSIVCIYCEEKSPGDYLFWVLFDSKGLKTYFRIQKHEVVYCTADDPKLKNSDPHMGTYTTIKDIVNSMISRLQHSKLGTVSLPARAKFKDAEGKKQLYKAKNVIYVGRRDHTDSTRPISINNKKINWTHKWDVAAHWRKLPNPESLGLDREGNRTVKGYTFIKSYLKGEGAYLAKTRIVRSN